MPAARPRMQVTPSETAYRLLKRISELSGQAPATITRELLDEAVPAMEVTIQALELVKGRPQEAQAALARFAAESINKLTQAQLELDKAIEGKRGRKPKRVSSG